MSEKCIQTLIFKELGSRPTVRLFRNNVGSAWMGKSRRIKCGGVTKVEAGDVILTGARRVVFGLHKGSSDLIGWEKVTITEDMVGQEIARFVSIEVKTSQGRIMPDQENWLGAVNRAGGRAGVARSVPQALDIIGGDHGVDE